MGFIESPTYLISPSRAPVSSNLPSQGAGYARPRRLRPKRSFPKPVLGADEGSGVTLLSSRSRWIRSTLRLRSSLHDRRDNTFGHPVRSPVRHAIIRPCSRLKYPFEGLLAHARLPRPPRLVTPCSAPGIPTLTPTPATSLSATLFSV
jgi:hypothetical protein